MFKILLFKFIILSQLFGVWLTYEDAVMKSPFKTASLGWKIDFPNEDSFLIRGEKDEWKLWYKVNILNGDTSLFLDSSVFNWQGDDLLVDELTFSKKNQKLLIKIDSKQIWRHSSSGTYFIYDLKIKKLYPLTKKNEELRNVKFSPNGKILAYVRNDNNIYIFDLIRKRERRLTKSGTETISNGHFGWLYEEELTGYDAYRWSPDSENIAFWEEDESEVPEFSLINDLTLYPEIKKIRYPKVGQKNPKLRIGVLRVKGVGKKWISNAITQDDYLPWMEWINTDQIGFKKMDRKQKNWDLYVADKKTGKSVKVLSETDTNGWVENSRELYFLEDGRILWISERSGFKHIWMSKHSGSKIWPVTQGKWEVDQIKHIDEKLKKVYFISNKESTFEKRLYSIRFDGTELKLLTHESGVHKIQILNSGKYFIDSFSSMEKPTNIKIKMLTTGSTLKILKNTEIQQYVDYDWSYPEIVHFPSLDNTTTLDGTLILPPDYSKKKKYPVIIHGYGMPGTQIVWNQWGKTWDQYLAQQGFIVFSMDTRGMSGRGEKFKNYSYGDMAKYLAKDQLAGIEFLVENKYADENRIGAWGWSGGGYFTCLMLTKNGKYFKAGVAIAPCTDFRLYDTAYTERLMGLISENQSGYDSTSTLTWINKMEGKLLIMHGTEDDNVHSQHTNHFVQKALRANKNIDWYQYPGRDHGIYGGGARRDLYGKMIRFFKENL